jgi:hypothetical protein
MIIIFPSTPCMLSHTASIFFIGIFYHALHAHHFIIDIPSRACGIVSSAHIDYEEKQKLYEEDDSLFIHPGAVVDEDWAARWIYYLLFSSVFLAGWYRVCSWIFGIVSLQSSSPLHDFLVSIRPRFQ